MKTFEFTDEQIKMLAHCIKVTINVNADAKDNLLKTCGDSEYSKEIIQDINTSVGKFQTLLNYINS